ncbi:MAG TPA: helix-turn-helix transcriptional regulator [Pyrinomonadaceae bacterium]|jgi:transcriptional regulator with XRE-family HTH domain
MRRTSRQRPARLAEKLLYIRATLGLSQNEMIRRLGFENELTQGHISAYERQKENRIPPPGILLAYARAISTTGGGEFLEALIDDEMELPNLFPASPSKVIKTKHPAGTKKC